MKVQHDLRDHIGEWKEVVGITIETPNGSIYIGECFEKEKLFLSGLRTGKNLIVQPRGPEHIRCWLEAGG